MFFFYCIENRRGFTLKTRLARIALQLPIGFIYPFPLPSRTEYYGKKLKKADSFGNV